MTNKIKFTQEINHGYLGAEGWGETASGGYAELPYFALYDGSEGVFDIIVDANGLSLYDVSGDNIGYYANNDSYSHFSAKCISEFIENWDADEFIRAAKSTLEFVEL